MPEFDQEKISALIAARLGRRFDIIKIEDAGSGYHSNGYKITSAQGEALFLKRVKSNDFGFEIPERRLSSFLVSHGMAARSGLDPQPVGVIVKNTKESMMIPDVNEGVEIYHIQNFESDGVSYWKLLQSKKEKTKVDATDIVELEKVIDFISSVHALKHPTADEAHKKAVYNDSLRSVLTHPELAITLLQGFTKDHPILPTKDHEWYVGRMLDVIHEWKDRSERLTALHGDFWGSNLFFRKDGSVWVIDYSRIPWGDPGIDIGWWLASYLWFYHETQNPYFKALGEKFLDLYVQKTHDPEIREATALVMGLMGIIFTTTQFHTDLNIPVAKRFIKVIKKILKEKKFVWET
jgi:Phosphotransferase enzyme family